jgi:hypothetical protein
MMPPVKIFVLTSLLATCTASAASDPSVGEDVEQRQSLRGAASHANSSAAINSEATEDYKFMGRSHCLDGAGKEYNRWWAYSLGYYKGDLSSCGCPECRSLCDLYPSCVGYDMYCCLKNGEKCIAGASVLFEKDGRPSDAPPSLFSTKGYYGSKISGPDFPGQGPIASITPDFTGNWKCYSKTSGEL